MKESILKDDLLFHSVHGLCRVSQITRSGRPEEVSYSLLPVSSNKTKVRFVVPQSSMENSGFGKLISVPEANAILEYLKTGDKKDSECGQTWALAETVWSEATSKEPVKDSRKRQKLEQSVKGLAGELAYIFNITLKQVAVKIQRSLGSVSSINPLVLSALANVGDE